MKRKVLAYIFKDSTEIEILVFDHHMLPEVNPQVIAGSVEEGESFSEAIIREVFEESGLSLERPQFIGVFNYLRQDIKEKQERHIYKFISDSLPSQWSHTVSSGEEDKGLEFKLYWLPVDHAKKILIADMGLYL